MVDTHKPTNERDQKDVDELRALIDIGRPEREIWTTITVMSHNKYPFGKGQQSHMLRVKYREWLKKQIGWTYNGKVLHQKIQVRK